MSDALTPDEHHAIDLTAQLVNTLARVVGRGPTRDHDLAELFGKIHDIQHAIMSQAAARAYPDDFRLLGQSINETDGRAATPDA